MLVHCGIRNQFTTPSSLLTPLKSPVETSLSYKLSYRLNKLNTRTLRRNARPFAIQASPDGSNNTDLKNDAEATTKKFGLEAGLWKVFTSKDADGRSKGEQAKQLLKRYGSAYLITSISFAIVSFAACYALVNAGVDVASLLGKVGLQVTDTSERVGTFAIAYAAHKALSPVRFPPTVALTPVVARWLGKDDDGSDGSVSSSQEDSS